MESFVEWAKGCDQKPCIQRWADRLVELGASWDSFNRKRTEVVDDFVVGGIPILAARDIVNVASAAVKRRQAPMAMPIPSDHSGRDVASRLKSVLAPHGDLVQFRGYASIGLGLIPAHKRSDLQLSGCHLVDCPHNGRKEVADKMIIVDSMQFAFDNPDGATLCFITGDIDYAYLLSVLKRPQWRTVVVAKGTLQSMLTFNCDSIVRWETDVLRMRCCSLSTPPGFSATDSSRSILGPSSRPTDLVDQSDAEMMTGFVPTLAFSSESSSEFELLTADEEWVDEIDFLRTVIREHGRLIDGVPGAVLKSLVGCTLRATNPVRFPNRDAIRNFLQLAIEKGAMVEHGEGAEKFVTVLGDASLSTGAPVPLSDRIPIAFQDIPPKVFEISGVMPFVIFVQWCRCPAGYVFPKGIFVSHHGPWAILMFHTFTNAQRAVKNLPWLREGGCLLVDWRRLDISSTRKAECSICSTLKSLPLMMRKIYSAEVSPEALFCSSDCLGWATTPRVDKEVAIDCVVSFMEMMSNNDDVTVPKALVRNQLSELYPHRCSSRKVGSFWIEEALKVDRVLAFKPEGKSAKLKLYLPKNKQFTTCQFPPDVLDVSGEIDHVIDLLNARGGSLPRQILNESLANNFSAMYTPHHRTQVYVQAYSRGDFFLQRGVYGQVVGLTAEKASAGMEEIESIASADILSEPVPFANQGRAEKSVSLGSSDEASDQGSLSSDGFDDYDLEQLVELSRKGRVSG